MTHNDVLLNYEPSLRPLTRIVGVLDRLKHLVLNVCLLLSFRNVQKASEPGEGLGPDAQRAPGKDPLHPNSVDADRSDS